MQGSVDIIPVGSSYNYYPANGSYIDLNGSTDQVGGIATQQSFAAGTYTLTFDLGGNYVGPNYGDTAPKTTTISLGSWSTSITLNYNDPLSLYAYTFTTLGGHLAFVMGPETGIAADIGNILDNVSLFTPLPATWIMFLGGVLGFARLIYPRQKKSKIALPIT